MSGAREIEGRWTVGIRYVFNQIDRATWRNTLTYQVHPQVRLGVEYNPLADDVNPLANLVVITETEHRPALMLGTSSDRIGTPDGEAYFGTLSKDLSPWIGWSVAPYIGASFGTYEDRWRPIAGSRVSLVERLEAVVLFDGVKVHPMLNYSIDRHVFSFILVEGKDPGFSYSISF